MDNKRDIWLMNEGTHCFLPKWVIDLLPANGIHFVGENISLKELLWAAALLGSQHGKACLLGQVSVDEIAIGDQITVCFRTFAEADLMNTFADNAHLVLPASILRTAIMIGLQLPHAKEGVISCTRTTPFSAAELQTIFREGLSISQEILT